MRRSPRESEGGGSGRSAAFRGSNSDAAKASTIGDGDAGAVCKTPNNPNPKTLIRLRFPFGCFRLAVSVWRFGIFLFFGTVVQTRVWICLSDDLSEFVCQTI